MTKITTRQIVMPNDTNPSGFLFGGVLLSWIDMAAAMVAQKHSQMDVATVNLDALKFSTPIKLGDHVVIEASLVEVGNSSMKIKIAFHSENTKSNTKSEISIAHMTFVGLKDGNPATVPGLS